MTRELLELEMVMWDDERLAEFNDDERRGIIRRAYDAHNRLRRAVKMAGGVVAIGGLLVGGTSLLLGKLASMGLYGAAANSAFWAGAGGGSLASGGLGMAGGHAIIGGSALGATAGATTCALSQARIQSIRDEYSREIDSAIEREIILRHRRNRRG